jgi:DNA-binding transcriptional MerR regulator
MKRAGGRRYYRPDDVDLVRGIRHLLYGEGYTIRGVQRILREQGQKFVQVVWQPGAAPPLSGPADEAAEEGEAAPLENGARGVFGLLKGRGADEAAMSAADADLSRDDVRKLQSALDELGECRRLIDSALKDEAA